MAADLPRAEVLKARRVAFPDLVRIQESAQAAPSEFAAQALLRLAESDKLTDKLFRRELIEDAFEKAAYATRTISLRSISSSAITGTPAGIAAQASALRLDRLSLQSRAARDMQAIDPARARALFERMLVPAPATLSCKDSLVEDYTDYYQTARQLRPDLMNDLIARISSASQLAGAAEVLKAENLPGFAAALQRVEGDDRSFTRWLEELSKSMARLAPGNPMLTAAYRQYLSRNLHAVRCQESLNSDVADTAVADFNRYAGDTPLTASEAKESGKGEAAKSEQLLDAAYVESQRQRFQSLMFGQGNRGLTSQQKTDTAWQQAFSEFMGEMTGMKPNPGESEAAFFYRKGGAWQTLLLAAPPGPERDKVLIEYIGFLQSSNFQRENPVEWFAPVESLMSMSRTAAPAERAKLLDALLASGHPVIRLYAMLEKQTAVRPEWAN